MKKTGWIALGVLLATAATVAAHAEVVTDSKEFLKEQLGAHPKKSKETFPIDAAQLKKMKSVAENASDTSMSFYYAKSADDQLQVACTIVPQEGKEGPMQLGICFDGSGLVRAVRVIEFNEDHGRPVKELAFLKQFTGKKATAAFKVKQDIDAVSGATRSSEAVSEGVRKAAFGFQEFVQKKAVKK